MRSNGRPLPEANEIIVATGLHPNLQPLSELRLAIDQTT